MKNEACGMRCMHFSEDLSAIGFGKISRNMTGKYGAFVYEDVNR